MSTRAPIGHLAINDVEMAFNDQGCRAIVPSHDLDTMFLYWFLFLHRSELQKLGVGTTFKELSGATIKQYQIPLPPLDEQKHIVAKLDAVRAEIDCLEAEYTRQLDDIDALRQSLLQKAFAGELS